MMDEKSLTLITEENIAAFRPAIGEEFDRREDDDLFVGVLDDARQAAAAAAFREEAGTLWLLRIADDEAHRGQGYAHFLMEEMKQRCKEGGIREIGTHLFLPEGEEEGPWCKWLRRQDFTFAEIPAKRYRIRLSALYEKQPFMKRSLREGDEIKQTGDGPFDLVLIKKKISVAELHAEPFGKEIYLSNVSAKAGHFSDVRFLIDEALTRIREQAGAVEFLIMDIGGNRLMEYVEASLRHQGIEIDSTLNCIYAAVDLEEESNE